DAADAGEALLALLGAIDQIIILLAFDHAIAPVPAGGVGMDIIAHIRARDPYPVVIGALIGLRFEADEHAMLVIHRDEGAHHDVLLEARDRRHDPEREEEMRDAPISAARQGRR